MAQLAPRREPTRESDLRDLKRYVFRTVGKLSDEITNLGGNPFKYTKDIDWRCAVILINEMIDREKTSHQKISE